MSVYSIPAYQQIIEQELEKICQTFPLKPAELYEPISYTLSMGGKRLRPALTLLSCDLFESPAHKALPAALALEVFHNFTLMHDDLMDKAPLRRGKASVHTRWNNNIAILSGDAMLVKAYEILSSSDPTTLRQVLDIFNSTALEVCEGQQLDMNYELVPNLPVNDYLHMIRLKTAVLIGACMKIGALIGRASEKDASSLYEFGVNIGMAFQIQDDLLDVFGDPSVFGKQLGGDIVANKKTYLLLKAMEIATHNDRKDLEKWFSSSPSDTKEKIDAVKDMYLRLNIHTLAEEKMKLFHEESIRHLDSLSLLSEKKDFLLTFSNSLLQRQR